MRHATLESALQGSYHLEQGDIMGDFRFRRYICAALPSHRVAHIKTSTIRIEQDVGKELASGSNPCRAHPFCFLTCPPMKEISGCNLRFNPYNYVEGQISCPT